MDTHSLFRHRVDSQTSSIESAHGSGGIIRDIDFNPNKPWHFLTAGDDSKIKVSCLFCEILIGLFVHYTFVW